MKTLLFILGLQMLSFSAFSQGMQLNDPVSNRTFNVNKYADVTGSPFLYENWIPANVVTTKGTFRQLNVKLDAYNSVLLFEKGEESYEFQDEVIKFTLTPHINDSASYQYYRKGITGPSLKKDQFVQVLAEGSLVFYKSELKIISEVNQINKGVVKVVSTTTRYYLGTPTSLELIKLAKTDVIRLMKDKAAQINELAEKHKVLFKKEAEVAALVRYYNSLK